MKEQDGIEALISCIVSALVIMGMIWLWTEYGSGDRWGD